MSGASPANRAAVALDRTISDPMPANDVVMASGRLNARKSMSGSGRKTRKGSTTTRVSARAIARGSWPSRLRTAFSSFAMAWADTGRPSGFFASARRMTRSTAATAGEPARAGGCSVSVALTTAITVRPPNAGRPASISNKMAPTANRSERASTGSPVISSGAMYPGVPNTAPERVRLSSESCVVCTSGRARPKSSSLTPWAVKNTFDGLRSRWTMPRA